MEKTYLEILAEQDTEAREEFQINPKELFVEHNRYEQEVNGDDHHEDELEDQEDFQKFGGSHQQASQLGALSPTKATHTTSVEYDKAVQIHVISVDSRFRTNRQDVNSDFLFKLVNRVKNVVSVRLSSIEIPNTWYTFANCRGNISFVISTSTQNPDGTYSTKAFTVTIPEGNYSLDTNLDNCLQTVLATAMNTAVPGKQFSVVLNSISGLITISANDEFTLDFTSGPFAGRIDNWGLGYNLGFRDGPPPYGNFTSTRVTPYAESVTAVALPDILGSNYVFLSLNADWRVVEHNHPDHSNLASFAKIVVDVNKNDIIYDNGSNLLTKTYNLKQPTDISSFKISLFDEYGQFLNLKGGEVSLTLEVTEVLHSALYESLRN